MRRSLTRLQMKQCIITLKTTLDAFDLRCGRKILFISDGSFFDHVRAFPLVRSAFGLQTLDELLDVMEPYLPLTLTDENFELFVHAAKLAGSDRSRPVLTGEAGYDPARVPDCFSRKARVDFIALARRADAPEHWEWIFNLCNTIREIKEELAGG